MELWDIYDENKQVTGRTMVRNDWNMKPGDFHLTVLGVVQRPDGRYLITKRDMSKAWAPGHWEVPGGGVMAGETSHDAIVREIFEETGIDVSDAGDGYKFTYKRVNPEEKDNYFVDVYKFVKDFDESDIKIEVRESSDYTLATVEEIEKYGKEGIFLHYESIKQIFQD